MEAHSRREFIISGVLRAYFESIFIRFQWHFSLNPVDKSVLFMIYKEGFPDILENLNIHKIFARLVPYF